MNRLLLLAGVLLSSLLHAQDIVITSPVTLTSSRLVRSVTIKKGGQLVLLGGLEIENDLTVEVGGEVRIENAPIRISGNIVNEGKVYTMGGIAFSGKSGPNTVMQTVKNYNGNGVGVFKDAVTTAPSAAFKHLRINNIAKPVAVKMDLGGAAGDTADADGKVTVSGHLAFENGVLDIGVYNQFYFTLSGTTSHTNGGLLRGIHKSGAEGGQMGKMFPSGASSFTFHIVDTEGDYEYSPVTVNLSKNTYSGKMVVLSVFGKRHSETKGAKDFLNRYWRFILTPIGEHEGTATFSYLPKDVVGSLAKMQVSAWNGRVWTPLGAASASNLKLAFSDKIKLGGTVCHITAKNAP